MNNKNKKKNTFYIIILFLAATIMTFTTIYICTSKFRIEGFEDNIKVNYKEDYKTKEFTVCYGTSFKCEKITPEIIGTVDTTRLGDYEIKYVYKYKNKTYNVLQTVSVVDEEPPVITIESAIVCPNEKINEVVYKVIDNYDGDITDKAKVTYKDKKIYIEAEDSNKNKSEKFIEAKIEDTSGPEIILNGDDLMSIRIYNSYEELGATATDKCDGEVSVDISGTVNTSVSGSYKILYSAVDSSNNRTEVERTVNVYDVSLGERVVYLTFDDGPSPYTNKLLDILKKYNVKATFFVTGNGSDEVLKRAYDEGHTIALHTNSHIYSYIYSNVDNYFNDLNEVKARVKRVTGYDSNMIRFPGGSSNLISAEYDNGIHIMSILTDEVTSRGYLYYDWNVDSNDAGGATTSDEVFKNVVSTLKEGSSVVLQHDVKEYSVDAVERIIQYGLSNGYTFEKLVPGSPTSHHGVFN